MAISFVNVGTVASAASGNITPALPASIAAGDILVLVVGAADNVVVTLPAAYTKKIELNSSTNCRLTVAWARATGSDSAPLVTHAAGDSIFGYVGAFRGCKSAGDPFTDAQSQASAAITTTITAPTITPLNGDFVIFAAAEGEGGTNNGSAQSITAWSGANPTFTTRGNYTDTGAGVHLVAGGFATGPSTGGATGSRTATLALTAQATANSVGALLALTQDAGGSSFPQTAMLPLTGLGLPGQPTVAPPIGPTRGSDEDPNTQDVVTPLPVTRFVHPLSLVMAARLFPAPQPIIPPSGATAWTLPLADTTTSTDQLANEVGKNVGDTTTSTDALVKDVGKNLTDTTTSTDALANRVGKTFTDTTTSTDALAKDVGKNVGDTTTSSDSVATTTAYHLAATDTTTSTDVLARVVSYHRTFTDTTTSTDSASLSIPSPPGVALGGQDMAPFISNW